MATKMDLDFLLSPSSKPRSRMNGSEGRSSRGESSARRDHPMPPSSSSSHRRMAEQSSHSRSSHGSSKTGASQTDSKSTSSKAAYKSKKTKASPPSSQKPSSSSENRPHVCSECSRPFYKQEQLKRHIRLVHENWRPYKCLFCEILFGTKQNMQVHFSTRKHRHRVETLEATNPKLARDLMFQQLRQL